MFETINKGSGGDYIEWERLKRDTTTLTDLGLIYHAAQNSYGEAQVHFMPYLDAGAPASPTYTATAQELSGGAKIYGVARIMAFSLGSMSAAYSDGTSADIGTSETAINKLNTNFQSASDVVVIASEQFHVGGTSPTISISSGLNKLQQDNNTGYQASNEYALHFPQVGNSDHGKGFGLLDRFASSPASPQYEVKGTASTTTISGEAKILAIAYKPTGTLLTFKEKYVVTSTTAATTTSSSLVDDAYAIQDFSLTASQTVLAIYQANSAYGASMPQAYGMQNAIRVDGTDYAKSWDAGTLANRPTRNTVFWIGTLTAGSHTIKGRFATGLSGQTATVSNRVLLIYILNGDAYRYVDSSTNSTTSGTSFVDDPEAQFTFTPPGSCKALILYNVANYYSSGQNENEYGKKIAIWAAGTEYAQAEKSPYDDTYPGSVFTAWAMSLSASSTTVKGRFACSTTSSVYINRRQLGILMFADSTLLNTVSSDTQVSTSSTSLVDDSQATISRTTSDARELLVVAMGTKRSGTSDSYNGSCYGIMIDGNDRANSRSSPKTSGATYAHSAATAYAQNLAAGSHTIKGRFANNAGGTTIIDSRRIVALWLACPPPVPEYPFGALILVMPLLVMYVYLTRILSPAFNSKKT